jgi:glucuronate isomerase
MKLTKQYYIEHLLHTPLNYTCTNLSEHSSELSHDQVNSFLRKEQFSSSELWDLVKTRLCGSADSVIIADNSVQDKRYSKFIELIKTVQRQ